VIDKIEREPRGVLVERLAKGGIAAERAVRVLDAVAASDASALRAMHGSAAAVREGLDRLDQYLALLDAHGVRDWVRFDLSIVRGLAYYTGLVFELFDRRGEFRAICGGGRYDTLLRDLGGVDLPALGFGMGDVVLGELLRREQRLGGSARGVDYWVVPGDGVSPDYVLRVAAALRRAKDPLRGDHFSVTHLLNRETMARRKARSQLQDATKAGPVRTLYIRDERGDGEIIRNRGQGLTVAGTKVSCDPEALLMAGGPDAGMLAPFAISTEEAGDDFATGRP
jgi:histidyl-tRNA synthetase